MSVFKWKLVRYARYYVIIDDIKDKNNSDLAKWKVRFLNNLFKI